MQPSFGIILLNLGTFAVTLKNPHSKKKKVRKIEEWLSCSLSTSKYSTQQRVCFPSFFLQHRHRCCTVILAGLWRWLQTLQSSCPVIRSTGCWLDLTLLEKESKRQRVGERKLGTLWWLQSYSNAMQQRVKASQDVFQNQNYIFAASSHYHCPDHFDLYSSLWGTHTHKSRTKTALVSSLWILFPAVVALTGLETKSQVLFVCDQDKTEYKCGRGRDRTKAIKQMVLIPEMAKLH